MSYTELSFSESSTRTQNRPNQQAFDAMVPKEKGGFYPNLDLAKFVCALLVVVIHTSPLENTAELAHFYLNNVFARVAVPLFFAASGFLFCRGLTFENGRIARTKGNLRRLILTVRRNVVLYVIWSLAYLAVALPEWYRSGWWGIAALKDWLHAFFLIGRPYQLWYLLSLFLALPMLYILLSVLPLKRLWMAVAVLWTLECLTYSYSWIGTDKIALIEFISAKMPVVFDSSLRALPLMATGALLSQKQHRTIGVPAAVGAFTLCAAEASALYFFSPNCSFYSYLFATPLLAYALLGFLISGKQIGIPVSCQRTLRDMCLSIYCIHPMICIFAKWLGISEGLCFWLAVTVMSTGIAWLWHELKQKIFHKKS